MKLIKSIFLILLFITSAYSKTDILTTSQIYIDTSGKETIKSIQSKEFKPTKEFLNPYSDDPMIHRGYTRESVWLKFSIKNNSNTPMKKVLVLDNQMLDHITLFTFNSTTSSKAGVLEPEKKEVLGVLNNRTFDENILDFYFNIELNPKETKEYYLNVSSLSCAVYFKLELMDKSELYEAEINHQLILTLFFGAMLALVLYNLFIYFFTKDVAYLYYVFYIFFTIWNHASFSGMIDYLYNISPHYSYITSIDAFLAIFYISLTSIFALLFTRNFLNIKNYKKIDFIFKSFIVINIILLIFSFSKYYPIDIITIILFLSIAFMIVVSYYLLIQKEPNARFFIVGWTFAVFGWFMLGLQQYGLYSLNYNYEYFYELTVFIEAILFSIALSAKLNKTKELEIAVNKSKILTKELHHRVKNNMQFIISMYRLKLSKTMDEKLSSILNEIELTIQAMSATHEMLYSKSNLEQIDTKEYFSSLIKRISQSFNLKEIKIETNIDTKLDIDKSITLGIILNELITNSLKYAFTENKGTITISLHKEDKNYELIYCDNGIGFDTKNTKKSFGTKIIENLVKDDLKGNITIKNHSGITYKIKF